VYGRVFKAALLGIGAFVASGCGQELPKPASALRPLDEAHAVAIMAKAFRDVGLDPVRNRTIQFGTHSAELRLDVAAKDRHFGIAYITWQDADALGDELPKKPGPDAILVVRGAGPDTETRAALLFSADYMQDDLSGDGHSVTSIAAEQKLERATRDVLRRAERENWE
jgi:hypothetical protein